MATPLRLTLLSTGIFASLFSLPTLAQEDSETMIVTASYFKRAVTEETRS